MIQAIFYFSVKHEVDSYTGSPTGRYALLMPIEIMNKLHSGFTWDKMVFINYMKIF